MDRDVLVAGTPVAMTEVLPTASPYFPRVTRVENPPRDAVPDTDLPSA